MGGAADAAPADAAPAQGDAMQAGCRRRGLRAPLYHPLALPRLLQLYHP